MKIPQTNNWQSRTGKFLSVNMFGTRYHLLFLHVQDVLHNVPVPSLRYIRMGECALVEHEGTVMVAIDMRDEIQKAMDDEVCVVVAAIKNGAAVVSMGFIVSDGGEFMGKLTREYGMEPGDLTPPPPLRLERGRKRSGCESRIDPPLSTLSGLERGEEEIRM